MRLGLAMPLFIFLITIVHLRTGAQSITKAEENLYAGNFMEAAKEYDKILISQNSLSALDKGNCYLRRGVCFFQLQKNDSAILDFFEALKLFEQIKNNDRIASAVNNIGNSYQKKEDYVQGEKYFKRAYELYKQLNDTVNILKGLNNLAISASYRGDTTQAVQLHKQAILSYADKESLPIFGTHYLNLANNYVTRNTDTALYFYNKALENSVLNEDSVMIASTQNNIGSLFINRKEYSKALYYLLASEKIYNSYPDSSEQADVFGNLADVYHSQGDYKKAFSYLEKSKLYREQLMNEAKNKASAELSEKYESDKKDAEIISQQKQNKLKSRNLLLSLLALGLVGFLGGLSFINYRKKQKANKLLHQQNEHILSLNKKLDASNQVKTKLFSIISHDLRSPVSSLFAYLQLQQHTGKAPTAETTTAVTRQTENLLETLEDLLMWSKSQLEQFTPEYSNLNLNQSITEAKELCGTDSAIKKLIFSNAISPDIVLRTDINMFTIIIRNIMANAVQNAIPGTAITAEYQQAGNHHLITLQNATAMAEKELLLTLNSELVNSKKHGLGRILIQEFTEKLNGKLEYTVTDGKLNTIIQLPV
jgi:tetratricopeptide (TPR) repeat protein